jgi:hypothetical protein
MAQKALKLSRKVDECKPLVTGATTVGSTLGVSGDTSLSALSVAGDATMSTTLGVTGAAIMSSTLEVAGITTMVADLVLTGNTAALTHTGMTGLAITSTTGYVDVEGLRFTGAQIGTSSVPNVIAVSDTGVVITGDLSSTSFTLEGDFAVGDDKFTVEASSGNTAVAGTLAVAGAFNPASIGVTGAASVGTTLAVSGATTLSDTLAITGATTVGSTLGVSGDTSLSALSVAGAATMSTTLGVTGAATMSSTLEVAGITTMVDDLKLTENTAALTHTGVFGLGIKSDLGYVDVEDIRFTGNLIGIDGDTSLITLTSGSVAVSGAFSFTGDLAVGANKFTVAADTGNAVLAGSLNVAGITTLADALKLSENAAEVTHTGSTGLAITSTFHHVDVEDVRFTGNLIGIDGDTSLITLTAGSVAVNGAFSFTGDLDVGPGKFTVAAGTGNVAIAGTFDVAGITALADDFKLSKNNATLTHTGTTGLAITSTDGYVDVEDLRFTDNNIGTPNKADVFSVSDGGVTVLGTLSATDFLNNGEGNGAHFSYTGDFAVGENLFLAGRTPDSPQLEPSLEPSSTPGCLV